MKTDADIIQYIMESEMSETVKTVFCELVSQSRRNREQLETLTEFARRQGWLENSESTRIVGRVIWQAEQLRASRDEAVKALEEARAKLDYVHKMGLRFGMLKTSDKPEPYLAHTWTEDSDHERMFREWSHSIGWQEKLTTATARLAEAERDGKRLDWLEGDAIYHVEIRTQPSGENLFTGLPLGKQNNRNLRAAIDQATAAALEG